MDATIEPLEPAMSTGRSTLSPLSPLSLLSLLSPLSKVGVAPTTTLGPRRPSRVTSSRSSSRSLFARRCWVGDLASRTPRATRSRAPTRPRIDSDPRRHRGIRRQPEGRGKCSRTGEVDRWLARVAGSGPPPPQGLDGAGGGFGEVFDSNTDDGGARSAGGRRLPTGFDGGVWGGAPSRVGRRCCRSGQRWWSGSGRGQSGWSGRTARRASCDGVGGPGCSGRARPGRGVGPVSG